MHARQAKLQIRLLFAYNYRMNISKTTFFLTLCLSAVLLWACTNENGNVNAPSGANAAGDTAANANSAKTNVEELGLLANVPYETEDIVWKEDKVNAKLTAVLRFSPEDADKIVAESEKNGAPQRVNIAMESWFPAELTAQSELSGDQSLKGLAYPANIFYLAPYSSGRVARIEGSDYFILDLSAK